MLRILAVLLAASALGCGDRDSSQVDRLQSRISELEAENAQAEEKLSAALQQRDAASDSLEELRAELNSYELEVRSLRSRVESQANNESTIENATKELQRRLDIAKQRAAEAKAKHEIAAKEFFDYQVGYEYGGRGNRISLDNLRSVAQSLKKKHEEAQARVQAIEDEMAYIRTYNKLP